MSVSAVSNAPVSLGFRPQTAPQAEAHEVRKNDESREHRHQAHGRSPQPRALSVFKQELRVAFEASFRAKFAVTQPGYAPLQDKPDSDDIVRDALGAARQLVSEAPTDSAKSLITFRATVHQAASYVRQTLGAQDDIAEVDDALARVNEGLDELETDVAKNQVSNTTALEVDVRSKQRTTIKIRTQEGDIVKLSIKRSDRLSASDFSTTEDGKTSSTTEVEISSRSRLKLSVEGDLNDDELAAIRNVFAQAEEIANQFFAGDIAAAFDLATGFEFDADQLARVRLNFRSFQSTSIAYTETKQSRLPAVAASSPQVAPTVATAAPAAGNSEAKVLPPADRPVIIDSSVVDPQVDVEVAETISPPTQSLVDLSSFTELFELLSDFLRSVGGGFETGGESGSASFRYHYSESFKLTLLLAVVNEVAPEESDKEAVTVSAVIGTIADRSADKSTDQTELDVVAA